MLEHPGGEGTENDTIVVVRFDTSFRGGVIAVRSRNACGESSAKTLELTTSTPNMLGSITASAGLLSGSCVGGMGRLISYSVPGLSLNSASIAWEVPAGGEIILGQGTTTIVVEYPPTGYIAGYVRARGVNNCSVGVWTQVYYKLSAACSGRMLITKDKESIEGLLENQKAEVYPNPSSGSFMMKLPSIHTEPTKAFIYDMRGVLKATYIIPSGTRFIRIGEELAKGTYIVRYILQGKLYSEKLIKL
jgi:hypothetical protein